MTIHPRKILPAISILVLLAPAAKAADDGSTVSMSLAECLKATLEKNQDIAIARKDRMGAAMLHDAAHGIFDPLVNASLDKSHTESPATSALSGATVLESDRDDASASVTQLLPWGGTLGATLTAGRTETNSSYSSINPSYASGLTLSFRHPLLKNRGKDITRYQIRLTKISERSASDALALEVIRDVQSTENAYWDLVLARNVLDVKRQSLLVAKDLLAQNTIRVEVGTLAPIELVQAEAGVAQRNVDIITTEAQLKDTDEKLKRLMGVPLDSPLWLKTIVPSDALTYDAPTIDLPAALSAARDKRAEIRLAQKALEEKRITTEYRRNQSRPQLDATATYASSGVGGDVIVRDENLQVTGVIPGGLSDALRQVRGIDYPAWTLGLSYAFPVRNRAGKGSFANARIEEEKAAIALAKAEADVDLDVRASLRAVKTTADTVEASRVAAQAQRKQLEAEQKKFENGLSTSFQVLLIDEDRAQAESQLRQAEVAARKSVVNLLRAMGTLLEEKSIAIEER